MAKLILQYQVKRTKHDGDWCFREVWEARTMEKTFDPDREFRDVLDEAFCEACDSGCDPNKNIRWKVFD